jgi:hypothetical protein
MGQPIPMRLYNLMPGELPILRRVKETLAPIIRPVHFGCLLASIAITIYWTIRIPPSGYAVAILGVVAIAMVLNERMHPGEKVIWMMVVFALLIVELRAISNDRQQHSNEQAEIRKQELLRFEKIATGIDNSIRNSQKQFEATMGRTEEIIKLETVAINKAKRGIDEITGGDNYCHLSFHTYKGHILIHNTGEYPLYGIQIRITDLRELDKMFKDRKGNLLFDDMFKHSTQIDLGDLHAHTTTNRPNPISLDGRKEANFNVFFSARNGYWTQLYRLRLIGGKWVAAIRVTRSVPKTKKPILYEKIDPEFPKNAKGEVDW